MKHPKKFSPDCPHRAPAEASISDIVEALTIEPCHVTGMHNPTHTTKYVCELQKAKAFDRVLAVLGLKEPPRRLHKDCGWCTDPRLEQHEELARWAKKDRSTTSRR